MELGLLFLLGAIWGGSFLFLRIAAPVVGAISLIQWRMILAALALLPFTWTKGKKLSRNDYSHLLVIGVLNSAVPFTLLAYASTSLSAGFTAILIATSPFFSAIFGAIFFRERLSARQSSGLAIGFIGAWILLSDKISIKEGATQSLLPIVAGIAASACYGFIINYSKRNVTHIPIKKFAFWNCFFASLALLPLSYGGIQLWQYENKILYCTLALGVLCTAIAYQIYFKLLYVAGATRAISVTFLVPIFACLWGWLFLGEIVTLKMALGAAVVFWGIWRMTKK